MIINSYKIKANIITLNFQKIVKKWIKMIRNIK